MDAEPGTVSARFAHLLEPIRDLAENWNIDIAAQLEQYLSEVRAAFCNGFFKCRFHLL